MMLHSSTQELIRKLCELTEAGAITWKEGEDGSSIFETEGYLVEIAAEPPGVRLLRADGRELERADAADLAAPWHDGDGTFASHVADMSRRAERIARGAESAIAKILSSLSSPPKKPIEPEPESAALAFDATPIIKSTHSISAGESAAAFAAVSADLESQRRRAADEPPVSHSAPEPDPAPVIAVPPETETAIDRVLAIQPVAQVEPQQAEPEPEPTPEPVAAGADPVAAASPPAPEVAPEPEPELVIASAPAIAPEQESAPLPAPVVAASPKRGFGAIDGFTRARSAPAEPPEPAWASAAVPPPAPPPAGPSKVTSTGLLVRGFSAHTHQTVESSTAKDFLRPAVSTPTTPPAPLPPPQEKQLETTAASGADIYKPWA
jgi:hypothetical protein